MKNLVLLSAVAVTLFMAGCNAKRPKVDMTSDASQMLNESVASTVNMDMNANMGNMNGMMDKFQNIYFDYDKFNIRSDMKDVINADAMALKAAGADVKIMVEGNCDEWGSDEYNYALGQKRAKAVKAALVAKGVKANRIQTLSNGESKPVCTEKTKDCDAKNRRAEIKVMLNK